MTFDQAFDRAATLAKAITVDESVSSYFGSGCGLGDKGRFRKRILRFAPTAAERVKAVESVRAYCRQCYADGIAPAASQCIALAKAAVGFGPLTVLWIVTMVAQLLAALKHLLQEPAGQEKC